MDENSQWRGSHDSAQSSDQWADGEPTVDLSRIYTLSDPSRACVTRSGQHTFSFSPLRIAFRVSAIALRYGGGGVVARRGPAPGGV